MVIADVLRAKGSDVERIGANETVADAVRHLSENRIGALVVEDRWLHLAGIFSERDFLNAVAKQGASALDRQVAELMSSPVLTCHPADRLEDILAKMTNARIRHLPVVEDGNLIGIVSIGDLVKHRLAELEASVDVSRLKSRRE